MNGESNRKHQLDEQQDEDLLMLSNYNSRARQAAGDMLPDSDASARQETGKSSPKRRRSPIKYDPVPVKRDRESLSKLDEPLPDRKNKDRKISSDQKASRGRSRSTDKRKGSDKSRKSEHSKDGKQRHDRTEKSDKDRKDKAHEKSRAGRRTSRSRSPKDSRKSSKEQDKRKESKSSPERHKSKDGRAGSPPSKHTRNDTIKRAARSRSVSRDRDRERGRDRSGAHPPGRGPSPPSPRGRRLGADYEHDDMPPHRAALLGVPPRRRSLSPGRLLPLPRLHPSLYDDLAVDRRAAVDEYLAYEAEILARRRRLDERDELYELARRRALLEESFPPGLRGRLPPPRALSPPRLYERDLYLDDHYARGPQGFTRRGLPHPAAAYHSARGYPDLPPGMDPRLHDDRFDHRSRRYEERDRAPAPLPPHPLARSSGGGRGRSGYLGEIAGLGRIVDGKTGLRERELSERSVSPEDERRSRSPGRDQEGETPKEGDVKSDTDKKKSRSRSHSREGSKHDGNRHRSNSPVKHADNSTDVNTKHSPGKDQQAHDQAGDTSLEVKHARSSSPAKGKLAETATSQGDSHARKDSKQAAAAQAATTGGRENSTRKDDSKVRQDDDGPADKHDSRKTGRNRSGSPAGIGRGGRATSPERPSRRDSPSGAREVLARHHDYNEYHDRYPRDRHVDGRYSADDRYASERNDYYRDRGDGYCRYPSDRPGRPLPKPPHPAMLSGNNLHGRRPYDDGGYDDGQHAYINHPRNAYVTDRLREASDTGAGYSGSARHFEGQHQNADRDRSNAQHAATYAVIVDPARVQTITSIPAPAISGLDGKPYTSAAGAYAAPGAAAAAVTSTPGYTAAPQYQTGSSAAASGAGHNATASGTAAAAGGVLKGSAGIPRGGLTHGTSAGAASLGLAPTGIPGITRTATLGSAGASGGVANIKQALPDEAATVWYYLDPEGQQQGPCSVTNFKQWIKNMSAKPELHDQLKQFESALTWSAMNPIKRPLLAVVSQYH